MYQYQVKNNNNVMEYAPYFLHAKATKFCLQGVVTKINGSSKTSIVEKKLQVLRLNKEWNAYKEK